MAGIDYEGDPVTDTTALDEAGRIYGGESNPRRTVGSVASDAMHTCLYPVRIIGLIIMLVVLMVVAGVKILLDILFAKGGYP